MVRLTYAKKDLSTFKKYYYLTKPGIIQGNLMTCLAGFLLAASLQSFDLGLLLATLSGTALVIAAGCVFNNYFDRDMDKKMARTKKRALVIHSIPNWHALVLGVTLLLAGFGFLSLTNWLVMLIGAIGFIDYVFLYTFIKRHSVHSTLVGSVCGATSMVAGYCAVTGQFDTAALLLGLLMTAWQMPHTYAMAMRRHDDYKAADIPIMPVVKGMEVTKVYTLVWIVVFTVAVSLLTVFDYTGWTYLVVMLGISLYWFTKGLRFYKGDDVVWGKKMFLTSLIVLLTTSVMLSVGALLP